MKRNLKRVAGATVVGIAMAFATVTPAFAWHPEGVITKYVQNQTAGGQMADANTAASAVSVKPGDVLKYTIVIENKGKADSRGWNDMHYTVLTDNLPAGVELISDASKRTITENIGIIKAGQKVTKEYVVKVTSTKNGDVIENKGCFTGDSEVRDNRQEGCNPAVIKVNVPPVVTPNPTPTPTPTPPQVLSATPEVLPVTGPGGVLGAAGAVSVLGYIGNLIRIRRRTQR